MAGYGRAHLHDLGFAVDRLPSLTSEITTQALEAKATGTDCPDITGRMPPSLELPRRGEHVLTSGQHPLAVRTESTAVLFGPSPTTTIDKSSCIPFDGDEDDPDENGNGRDDVDWPDLAWDYAPAYQILQRIVSPSAARSSTPKGTTDEALHPCRYGHVRSLFGRRTRTGRSFADQADRESATQKACP